MIESLCVIDDNEVDIYQVERIVKKSSSVKHFYSFCHGKEALDHFIDFEKSKKKFDGHFPPKVILLDINMPRMNGFEFLEEFSKLPNEKKNCLIIMMLTSSDQEEDKERARSFSNVQDFFIKPFNKDQLNSILKMAGGG